MIHSYIAFCTSNTNRYPFKIKNWIGDKKGFIAISSRYNTTADIVPTYATVLPRLKLANCISRVGSSSLLQVYKSFLNQFFNRQTLDYGKTWNLTKTVSGAVPKVTCRLHDS